MKERMNRGHLVFSVCADDVRIRAAGAKPSLITFAYGPINSGKTALITHG